MNSLRRHCLVYACSMGATALVSAVLEPQRRKGSLALVNLEHLFPMQFGQWRASGAMNAFVRPADHPANRIYSQVLERTYVDSGGRPVMLSVAVGASQTDEMDLHQPEVCYRYGGFTIRGVRPDSVHTTRSPVAINRLIAEMPGRPEAVSYWTVLGGQLARDANTFRLLMLSYAAQRIVVDGMLIRVSSIDPVYERAYALHDSFIAELAQELPLASRSMVFGQSAAGDRAS